MKLFDNAFWNAIVTAIISAIVTNVCLWWHKKTDYKREYYKKIIDKRITAYEKLSNSISFVGLKATYPLGDEVKEMHVCFEDLNKLKEANQKIVLLKSETCWFSKNILFNLVKLNNIFADLLDRIIKDNSNGNYWIYEDSIEEGFRLYNDIESLLNNIKILISKDITNLYDVEGFFEEQKEQINK